VAITRKAKMGIPDVRVVFLKITPSLAESAARSIAAQKSMKN